MSMPGFTADDSLYLSRTRYNMIATKFLAVNADIRPQRDEELCREIEASIQRDLLGMVEGALAGNVDRVIFNRHWLNLDTFGYIHNRC